MLAKSIHSNHGNYPGHVHRPLHVTASNQEVGPGHQQTSARNKSRAFCSLTEIKRGEDCPGIGQCNVYGNCIWPNYSNEKSIVKCQAIEKLLTN